MMKKLYRYDTKMFQQTIWPERLNFPPNKCNERAVTHKINISYDMYCSEISYYFLQIIFLVCRIIYDVVCIEIQS